MHVAWEAPDPRGPQAAGIVPGNPRKRTPLLRFNEAVYLRIRCVSSTGGELVPHGGNWSLGSGPEYHAKTQSES